MENKKHRLLMQKRTGENERHYHDMWMDTLKKLEKAEAEIVRLREGLRDLRYGIFKDSDAVEGFIDGLLKVEINKEF